MNLDQIQGFVAFGVNGLDFGDWGFGFAKFELSKGWISDRDGLDGGGDCGGPG